MALDADCRDSHTLAMTEQIRVQSGSKSARLCRGVNIIINKLQIAASNAEKKCARSDAESRTQGVNPRQ